VTSSPRARHLLRPSWPVSWTLDSQCWMRNTPFDRFTDLFSFEQLRGVKPFLFTNLGRSSYFQVPFSYACCRASQFATVGVKPVLERVAQADALILSVYTRHSPFNLSRLEGYDSFPMINYILVSIVVSTSLLSRSLSECYPSRPTYSGPSVFPADRRH
jgi:hypothetical protein